MTDADADAARDAALTRLDALEAELEQLAEHVRQAATRLRADVARARADVHDLHASAPSGPPVPEPPAEPTPRTEPPVGGDAPEGAEEGARLVALDLLVRGTERADAERELAGAFPGVDAPRLLDEAAAALGAD
jgi:hypothetical protein